MIYDLHTHTTASDGSLSPNDLLGLAASNGVDVLAITDHDTIAGFRAARDGHGGRPELIAGVEFSAGWMRRGVHVVGLNVDPDSAALQSAIESQQAVRRRRARGIADRLVKAGLDDCFDAVVARAGDAAIGRPHFAAHLVETGAVKNTAAAFRKYLGAGKAGDVRHVWPSLDTVVQWIEAAGGVAVLAHPAKYRMTNTKLRALLKDFVDAGGRGLEVICGQQNPQLTAQMAALAREFDLHASVGSDFHHPDMHWALPGRFPELPSDLRGVWELWRNS